MKPEEYEDLDAFIDAALRDEPIRDTPFGFHSRFEERLRFTVALQRERARFRNCLASVACLVVLLGLCVGVTLGSGHVASRLAASIPGALGYYDRFSIGAGVWGPMVFGVATLAIMGMVLGLFAFETTRGRAVRPV